MERKIFYVVYVLWECVFWNRDDCPGIETFCVVYDSVQKQSYYKTLRMKTKNTHGCIAGRVENKSLFEKTEENLQAALAQMRN
jgi:hypothetical protein